MVTCANHWLRCLVTKAELLPLARHCSPVRGADLNLSPGCPRILVHIGFEVRNDNVCALHYTAADHNHLRIVRMNQPDASGRPDVQTAVAYRNGHLVATCSFFKKLFEPDVRISRQNAVCRSGPIPYYQGK